METLTLPKNGFKMPDQPNKSGKARRKTKYLNLQHSSTTTDGSEAASQEEEGVKRCENKEYFVVDCAKEQIWTKFLKDFEFVVKEEDSLYTAGPCSQRTSMANGRSSSWSPTEGSPPWSTRAWMSR